MPHEPERNLVTRLYDILRDHFGSIRVEHQPVLPETDRRPDLLVHTGLATWALECESQPEAIIDGVGQCIVYRGHPDVDVAMLVVAGKDHLLEYPELEYVRRVVPVLTEGELMHRLTLDS